MVPDLKLPEASNYLDWMLLSFEMSSVGKTIELVRVVLLMNETAELDLMVDLLRKDKIKRFFHLSDKYFLFKTISVAPCNCINNRCC